MIAKNESVEASMVLRAVEIVIRQENADAGTFLMQGSLSHFRVDPIFWLDQVFLPCLTILTPEATWQFILQSCREIDEDSLVANLDETNAKRLLDSMIDIPEVDYEMECLLEIVAMKHHELVLSWFGNRIRNSKGRSTIEYRPFPFRFGRVYKVLQSHPESVVSVAMSWWDSDASVENWRIVHFVKFLFRDSEGSLLNTIRAMIEESDRSELEFITELILVLEVRSELLPLFREILASSSVTEEIEGKIAVAISNPGETSGEFGVAEAYKQKG